MPRKPDWERALAAAIEAARRKRFAWGRHDCCLFAADLILAMTGDDPAAHFRGCYDSAVSAHLALRRYGAGSLLATLEARFGQSKPPARAMRGDLVYARDPGSGPSCGICLGRLAVFAGDGISFVPTNSVLYAWSIDDG